MNSLGASVKKSYSFSLVIPGGRRLHLAAADHVDLHRWFLAMDAACQAEEGPKISGPKDVSKAVGGMETPKHVPKAAAGGVEVSKKKLNTQSTVGEGETKVQL